MNDEEDKAIERIDFLKGVDKSLEQFRERNKRLLETLTPKEREIVEKRFKEKLT